jgi:hypothetical protein
MARGIQRADESVGVADEWEEGEAYVPLLGAEKIGGDDGLPPAYILSPEESHWQYDLAVRKYMGMSAEEFLRRWDAGEWHELYDDGEHWWIGVLVDGCTLAPEE